MSGLAGPTICPHCVGARHAPSWWPLGGLSDGALHAVSGSSTGLAIAGIAIAMAMPTTTIKTTKRRITSLPSKKNRGDLSTPII